MKTNYDLETECRSNKMQLSGQIMRCVIIPMHTQSQKEVHRSTLGLLWNDIMDKIDGPVERTVSNQLGHEN